jgi:16S rRNA (cytosine967-C5)-methyltransferase
VSAAREVALRVVRDVFPEDGKQVERTAHAAFDYRVRRAGLDARDTAFAAELAYGAIKMRRALDWYLAPYVPDSVPAAVRELLRLAAYELLYTRADEHAAVFEFVNVAKRVAHRGLANLVNAVLRRLLREKPSPPRRSQFEDDAEYFGTRYSLPTWLVVQWLDVFGTATEAICEGVNQPAQQAVVVNTLVNDVAKAQEKLAVCGAVTVQSTFVHESLLIRQGGVPPDAEGGWWQQSESSAMVADVLNPQPGETILDVCSGRGNKALQIGTRLAHDGALLCIERDERKTQILTERLERAGIAGAIVTGDATQELLPHGRGFERVLVDAPCSGVGIVGRQPEARWKKQKSDGERLAATQRALLEQIARHVLPGGVLVYAVCSTDPRETTEVMDWFLAQRDFERGSIAAKYEPWLGAAGDVLVPPGIERRDGFFIARLERRPS